MRPAPGGLTRVQLEILLAGELCEVSSEQLTGQLEGEESLRLTCAAGEGHREQIIEYLNSREDGSIPMVVCWKSAQQGWRKQLQVPVSVVTPQMVLSNSKGGALQFGQKLVVVDHLFFGPETKTAQAVIRAANQAKRRIVISNPQDRYADNTLPIETSFHLGRGVI